MKTFFITLAVELVLAWVGGCDFQRNADTAGLLVVLALFAFIVAFAAGMLDAME